MREVLFRAKAVRRGIGAVYRTGYRNGDWVYGWLTKPPNPYCPEKLPGEMRDTDGVSGIEVDFGTVGQYIGLEDAKGIMIFEGDIVQFNIDKTDSKPRIGKIFWDKKRAEFRVTVFNHTMSIDIPRLDCDGTRLEVIGNIYDDNPELLKSKE